MTVVYGFSNATGFYSTPRTINSSSWMTTSASNSPTSERQAGNTSSPNIVLGVFLLVVVFVTALANLFVLLLFAYEKKLRTTFSILIGNLALTDFIVAVIPMHFDTLRILFGYWRLGKVLCSIWGAVDYVSVMASNFFLIAISIDRLWAIKWSLHYRHNNTKKKAVTIVGAVW